MSFREANLSATEFSELLGVSVLNVRDWRRRGLLDGVGQRQGKQWLYSLEDAAKVAMAWQFRQLGLENRWAFKIPESVIAWVATYAEWYDYFGDGVNGRERYSIIFNIDNDKIFTCIAASDADDVVWCLKHYEAEAGFSLLIDHQSIPRQLPAALLSAIEDQVSSQPAKEEQSQGDTD